MPEGKFGVGGTGESSTAAIAVAGYSGIPTPSNFTLSSTTYTWNGSNWSVPGANVTRGNVAYATVFGPSGASLLASGSVSSSTTELWNGSTWTSNPATMTYNVKSRGGGGTQTSGILCGGYSNANNKAETWNGSTWASTVNMISQLTDQDPGVFGGSSTTAFASGGPSSRTPANSIELQTVGGATVLE